MRSGLWALIAALALACSPADEAPAGDAAADGMRAADATLDAMPDVMTDAMLDGIFDSMPDGMDQSAGDATRDAMPDDAVDGIPGDLAVAPDARIELDAGGDAAPDMPRDAAPDAVPDVMPDATPDVMPDAIADAMPDVLPPPDAAVDAVVDALPEPDAAPEPECRVDGDCPADEVCADGLCFRPPDGTCLGPFTAIIDVTHVGTTGGVGTDGGSCPGNNDLTAPEDIYRVVFPTDDPYCVNTRGSAFDTMLYIRTACGDPRTEVACRDDDFEINGPGGWAALTFEPDPFRAYYVTVDGYGSPGDAPRAGDYQLLITRGACQPPPECRPETEAADCGPDRRCADGRCVECVDDGDCPGGRCAESVCQGCIEDADCPAGGRCLDAVCEVALPANGSCAAPTEALPGVRYVGETAGDGALAGSCGAFDGAVDAPEAVFGFTAPRDGTWCASTAGSGFDTVLYLRQDCADPRTEVECSDDEFDLTDGPHGALSFDAVAGEELAIIVDGFALPGAGESGPYVMQVSEGPCAAP